MDVVNVCLVEFAWVALQTSIDRAPVLVWVCQIDAPRAL